MEASASHENNDDGPDAVRRLEQRYRRIAAERMAGIPIMNTALSVTAAGAYSWQGQWLTALVTPWFLNLVMLPAQGGGEPMQPTAPIKVGAKQIVALPGGRFEFIGSHDEELGPYAMCSLFSPVFEFADHETAVAAAEAALSAVLEETDAGPQEEDMIRIWRGEQPEPAAAVEEVAVKSNGKVQDGSKPAAGLSRRGLLLGRAPRGGAT